MELLKSDVEVGDYRMREKRMKLLLLHHHQELIIRVV